MQESTDLTFSPMLPAMEYCVCDSTPCQQFKTSAIWMVIVKERIRYWELWVNFPPNSFTSKIVFISSPAVMTYVDEEGKSPRERPLECELSLFLSLFSLSLSLSLNEVLNFDANRTH